MISNHAAIQAAAAWLIHLDAEQVLTPGMLTRLMEDCVKYAERMTSPAIIEGLFGAGCPLSVLVMPKPASARHHALPPHKFRDDLRGTPSWQLDRVGGLLGRALTARQSDVIEVDMDAATVLIYPSSRETSVLKQITLG